MTSGQLQVITDGTDGVGTWWEQNITFEWSPDSRLLAYALRPRPPAWLGDVKLTSSEHTAVIVGGPGDSPASSELFLYDRTTGTTRKVLTRRGARFGDLSWFPDGRRVVLTANHAAHEYHDGVLRGEILTLDLITGKELTIASPGGLQQGLAPVVSPDGRFVAFRYHADSRLYDFTMSVGVVADTGGTIRRLTGPELTVSSLVGWSADGGRVFFLRPFSPYRQIYSVSVAGTLQQVSAGARDITGAALSADGSLMAWCEVDARGGKTIVTASGDGSARRILVDLAPAVGNLRTGAVEEIQWLSTDGLEIRGLLILPVGYKAGERYPLVVDVHGGGDGSRIYFGGALLRATALEWHLWANLGYAVLVPDYRHSGNYGWRPILEARDNNRHYDRDFDDIMSGVDYAIARGIADSSRLAIIGASAGAYRVNWAITHTRRFKVAVSYEGWGDEYFLYGLVPGGNPILEWENGGLPWDVPQTYIRNSPAFKMKGVTTPTLFIAGGETTYGGAVPQYTTYFMNAALQRQGVETKFVIYRMEGHIVRRPENQRHVVNLIVDWVDSHLE
ncbi:MAG: prolyl oligopeptidase family serine peptidase [Gemmatimonadales bacterium]